MTVNWQTGYSQRHAKGVHRGDRRPCGSVDGFVGRCRADKIAVGLLPARHHQGRRRSGAETRPVRNLGRPRVGYIGRIAPQKDVGTLISAFGRLTGPACLLIVGDGPGRRAAEAQARRLAGPVRFTGFAPHARVPAVLRHIDLLVLATRYEELPSVLIEAMAAGLPVIASRVGGIPALVDHDVNGLLVPPGDPAALAAAISRVLAEPGTAPRLAAAARQTAQRYTWPALARQVAAVYLQLTAKPQPA